MLPILHKKQQIENEIRQFEEQVQLATVKRQQAEERRKFTEQEELLELQLVEKRAQDRKKRMQSLMEN